MQICSFNLSALNDKRRELDVSIASTFADTQGKWNYGMAVQE